MLQFIHNFRSQQIFCKSIPHEIHSPQTQTFFFLEQVFGKFFSSLDFERSEVDVNDTIGLPSDVDMFNTAQIRMMFLSIKQCFVAKCGKYARAKSSCNAGVQP